MSQTYQNLDLAKKLFAVDELPQGALPRYERDAASVAYVVARKGWPMSDVYAFEDDLPNPEFDQQLKDLL